VEIHNTLGRSRVIGMMSIFGSSLFAGGAPSAFSPDAGNGEFQRFIAGLAELSEPVALRYSISSLMTANLYL
jgi:hypothetical protein